MSKTEAAPSARALATLALLALATLLVMTLETLPVGLLPQMARGLGVSESHVGLLVTAYALVVVLGAIPLSALVARYPLRRTLVIVLATFVLSATATAASTHLPVAVAARLVGGASHAVFYSLTFSVAMTVVPANWRGRAVAILMSGNAIGLAFSLPAATALGAAAGWRVPFLGVAAVLAVVAAVFAVLYRPVGPGLDENTLPPAALIRAAASPPLLRVALIIVLLMGGHFFTFTYIVPILTGAGVAESGVGATLTAYGVGGIAGLVAATFLAERRPRLALVGMTGLTAVALLLLWVFRDQEAGVTVATALWGAAFGGAPPLWQIVAVRAAPRAAAVGPAVVNSAFNVGISAGAAAGGVALTWLAPAGLALVSLGLVVLSLGLMHLRTWLPADGGTLEPAPRPSDQKPIGSPA